MKVLRETNVAIDQIRPASKFQTRVVPARTSELAGSVRNFGLLQRVGLRPISDPNPKYHYDSLFGNQRIAAAKMNGLAEIPAIIIECSEEEGVQISVTENLVRSGLNSFEKELSIVRCREEGGFRSDRELAETLGLDPSWVSKVIRANKFRVAHGISERVPSTIIADSEKLEDDIRLQVLEDVAAERISQGQARAICRRDDDRRKWLAVRNTSGSVGKDPNGVAEQERRQPSARRLLDELVYAFNHEKDPGERANIALSAYAFFAQHVDDDKAVKRSKTSRARRLKETEGPL